MKTQIAGAFFLVLVSTSALLMLSPYVPAISALLNFPYSTTFREFADIALALQVLDGKLPFAYADMPAWSYNYGFLSAYIYAPLFALTDVSFAVTRYFGVLCLLVAMGLVVTRNSFWHKLFWLAVVAFISVFEGVKFYTFSSKPDMLGLLLCVLAFLALKLPLKDTFKFSISIALLLCAFYTKVYFCFFAIPLTLYIFFERGVGAALKYVLIGLIALLITNLAIAQLFPAYPYTVYFATFALANYHFDWVLNQWSWFLKNFWIILPILILSVPLSFSPRLLSGLSFVHFTASSRYFAMATVLYALLFSISMGGHEGSFGSFLLELVLFPALAVVLSASFNQPARYLMTLAVAAYCAIWSFGIAGGTSSVQSTLNVAEEAAHDMQEVDAFINAHADKRLYASDIASLAMWKLGMPVHDDGQSEFFVSGAAYDFDIGAFKHFYRDVPLVRRVDHDYRQSLEKKLAEKYYDLILCADHSTYCYQMSRSEHLAKNYEKIRDWTINTFTTGPRTYRLYKVR